jgi:hypothetical protein
MSKKMGAMSTVVMVLVVMLSVAHAGHVRRMRLPVREAAVITPADEPFQWSLLLKPDLRQLNENTHVLLAILSVDVNQLERSADGFAVQLDLMPLTTQWEPGQVSWDYPWVTPGGDVVRGYRETFLLKEPGLVRFDVTRLVRRWLDGRAQDCGILIRANSSLGGRFGVDLSGGEEDGLSPIEMALIVSQIDL